ncbi:lysophospholipid acyltransferase family protein [Bremerella cremea]|uniref:lysophospholipid acyltransferase family protein n=1 Tax=Bremerella cremea TaxID=1031537 RepID=UPI0031F0DBB3
MALLNLIAAYLFAAMLWLLFRTLKITILTQSPGTSPYQLDCPDRFLYAVWHDSMVLPVFGGRHRFTTALTSLHRDGSFVANVLRSRQIRTVRGSTRRISMVAIRELVETLAGRHLVITPDGPRGPNRTMSSGIVFLASRTGREIVPTGVACSNCWRWKGTWSSLLVPKPFSSIVIMAGEPIPVPPGLKKSELTPFVAKIQEAMDQLDQSAKASIEGRTQHGDAARINAHSNGVS